MIIAINDYTITSVADGAKGDKGDTGATIQSQKEQFYLSTSDSALSGGSWSYDEPSSIPSGKYLWGRLENTMTDGTKVYSSAVYRSTLAGVISSVDSVNQKITNKVWQSDITSSINSYDASTGKAIRDRVTQTETDISGINTTISDMQTSISTKADGSTVSSLSTRVNTISDTVDGHTQTITSIQSDVDGLDTRVTSAESSIQQNADNISLMVTVDGSTSSLSLTNNMLEAITDQFVIKDPAGSATIISGGKIHANAITTAMLAADAIKSTNYQAAASSTSPYSAAGTYLDLTTGSLYSPNFGINNTSGTAYLNGEIVASSGTIGDDNTNYWSIGNTTDANSDTSASIVGHGTAYIQDGYWQIHNGVSNYSNGSINTQWYESQSGSGLSITYPNYNNTYYDYGMTAPVLDSTSDRYYNETVSQNFLYIRKHASTIPALASDWEYLFRVDKDGKAYVSDLYVNGTSIAQMITDGVDGGAYLPTSGGTVNGNVTINGTLTATASKASALATAGTIQTNLASTSAVTYTNGGNITPGVTGKLGVANGGTGADTLKSGEALIGNGTGAVQTRAITNMTSAANITANTNLITANTLKFWNGAYDANGSSNLEYVKLGKLGDVVTHNADEFITSSGGAIDGSLSVTDLTAGDLIVNGAARFVNGILGNASTATKLANSVTIQTNLASTTAANFDGSANVTPGVTGTLPVGNGGTGQTTANAAANAFINALTTGDSTPGRNDYLITQYVNGGTTTTTYHRRTVAKLFAALNSSDITTALGYTPYNATNPNGYTTNTGTVTSVKAGTGLAGGTITTTGTLSLATITKSDSTSTASPTHGGTFTAVKTVTYDDYGRVTGVDTETVTLPADSNTHNTAYIRAGGSTGTANATTTSGNTYMFIVDGGTRSSGVKLVPGDNMTITSDASGNVTFKATDTTYTALKNPNALTLNVYDATTASSTYAPTAISYDGGTANISADVAGVEAITKISSNTSGQLVLVRSNGTSETIDVKITATTSDSAQYADRLAINDVGSGATPVYFDDGVPVACDQFAGATAVTLNNSSKAGTTASFYAPTASGTAGQILVSAGASKSPTWATVATGDTNGRIKIGSTEYAVKGLSNAAYKDVTDSSSASAIGTGTSLTTERDVYYGLPTINGAHNYTSSTTLFAPTSAGTSNYVLKSNGSGAPSWVEAAPKATQLATARNIKLTGDVTGSASFDGTADASITATVADNSHYHNSTTLSELPMINGSDVFSRPLVTTIRPNKLALLPADQIIIEKTTDGGTTWVDAGYTNDQKRWLFVGSISGTSITIPLLNGIRSKLCGVRITITGMKYNVPDGTAETAKYNYWNSNYIKSQERYFSLRTLYVWCSAVNDRISLKVEYASGSNSTNWGTAVNVKNLSGWSGGNVINGLQDRTFGGGTTQTGNYWNWRMTFFTDGLDGGDLATSSNTSAQQIMRICGYGSNAWGTPNYLMAHDHLYTWDINQNATFPAQITATQFNGKATSATTADTATTAATADKWTSAQTVYVTLGTASKTTTIQGGSSSAQTIGVDGTLGVAHGGTGATTFASGELLIGNGANAVGTRSIKNMTAVGNLGWTAAATDVYIPTVNTLAYWNGRYNGSNSNLAYCNQGAFGTAATYTASTSVGNNTNLPTGAAIQSYVSTAISNASNTYVTLSTAQTISGTKTFSATTAFTNTTASTSKSTGGVTMSGGLGVVGQVSSNTTMIGDHAVMSYDSTLQALVFSFN